MNTPDTEMDEIVKDFWSKFAGKNPSLIPKSINTWLRTTLTSRDTYWKERVRKVVEDYFDVRLEDLVNEHLLNGDPHTETRIFEAKKNRDEILTITNEDNLK